MKPKKRFVAFLLLLAVFCLPCLALDISQKEELLENLTILESNLTELQNNQKYLLTLTESQSNEIKRYKELSENSLLLLNQQNEALQTSEKSLKILNEKLTIAQQDYNAVEKYSKGLEKKVIKLTTGLAISISFGIVFLGIMIFAD